MKFKILVCLSLLGLGLSLPAQAKPVQVQNRAVAGASLQVVTVDLSDPQTDLKVFLGNNAPQANSSTNSYGAEGFGAMVQRAKAAAVINGTFFSKDAQQRVMGNMFSVGQPLKYSQWENFGTTFIVSADGKPEMRTMRAGDSVDFKSHWFSVTCGPRLLRQGKVWLNPDLEGFKDPHVLNAANRSALGFTQDGKTLFLVSFMSGVTLKHEAEVMKALGAYEAMNLDGGASQALAVGGRVLVPAGRNLTNVIAVYDSRYPAPATLKQARQSFQVAANTTPTPAPTATPQPLFTPPTPTAMATPATSEAAAQAPEQFFAAVYQKNYRQSWALLSEKSKQTMVREVLKAAGGKAPFSEADIRKMMDDYHPQFAPAFWDAFRANVQIDIWMKQKYKVLSATKQEAVVVTNPLGVQMKAYLENSQWRFGYMESFSE